MEFDAFISYSSKDKAVAHAACATLEGAGIRCWIAPRDIRPGGQYGAAIIEAIDHCRVMVLIFSSNSNDSQQIHREIERAVSKGVPIIPVRIEEIAPTESMEYFLGAIHWLDALTPPIENHLQQLAETVKALLQANATNRGTAHDASGKTMSRKGAVATGPSMTRDEDHRGATTQPQASKSGRPAWMFAALGIVCLGLLAGGSWAYLNREPTVASAPSPAPAPPVTPAPPAPPPRQAEILVPETIPFISDADRATVRTDYMPAPDHKALAIGNRVAFITGQKDDDAAGKAAVAACERVSPDRGVKCELYAVGDKVVSLSGRPPLPPEPWFIRNPAVERPFVGADIPLGSGQIELGKNYTKLAKPKALSISSRHRAYYHGQSGPDEAIRRSLEVCGRVSGISCIVIAVDDVFVVSIPATMKPVGLFRAGSEGAIAPEARDTIARRVANATSGWNAVAVGAAGRPGLGLGAAKEQDAIDGALTDCGRQDRACRVIAIGPFLVEPKDASPPAASTGELSCSGEQSTRSAGDKATIVSFSNQRSAPVRLYWLDQAGARKLYATIEPGQSKEQKTFVGHAWVVTDIADRCIAMYLAGAERRDYALR